MGEKKKAALGSGILYYTEFSTSLPNLSDIMVDANILGWIKGGATVEYTVDSFNDTDDLGYCKVDIITKEDVTLKTGFMTWNGETLTVLCSTGRSTTANGIRTTKIGGLGQQTNKSYVLLFVHKDDANGDTRLWIVGRNTSGFSFDYKPDAVTVLNSTFSAKAQDNDGTLLKLDEVIPLALGTPSATFDKNTSGDNYGDKTSTVNLSITSIKNGDTTLIADTNYTVANGTLTIKKEYLSTLSVGSAKLKIEASNSFIGYMTIAITDTTSA